MEEKKCAVSNMQKYSNYSEQMKRLDVAMEAQFYLEAIFIECAVMEDRLESILRHSGNYNPEKQRDFKRKWSKVEEISRSKQSFANRYFSRELLFAMDEWRDQRNGLVHALMNQKLTTEDLRTIAEQGYALAKQLTAKTSSYRDALKRQAAKAQKKDSEV